MPDFDVPDMTCGHCVRTITEAVQQRDPSARVATDLGAHRVSVESTVLAPEQIQAALAEAGYTPTPR